MHYSLPGFSNTVNIPLNTFQVRNANSTIEESLHRVEQIQELGAHLHTTPSTWREKVEAAYQSGCRRFDGALKGYGGCPMAKDDLTGNMRWRIFCIIWTILVWMQSLIVGRF